MTQQKHAPPWLFGLANLPFGVGGAYTSISVAFLLTQAKMSMGTIASVVALALMPASFQLLWAPILDLGIRRRAWLMLLSVLGGLCLAGSMLLHLPEQMLAYKVLLVAGAACTGLVASCVGALVSTTLPPPLRAEAAGWVNAGNLGSAVLGGGLVMYLATNYSNQAAAVGLFLVTALPALAALAIPEPPPLRVALGPHLRTMLGDVWAAVRSRTGWTGLLFCLSPVGTVGLLQLCSALGPDYHANKELVEQLSGVDSGFITAISALICGFILRRVNARYAYLFSGVLTAIVAVAMALGPKTPPAMVIGVVAYLIVAGLAYTAFSAVAYEIVGNAGASAAGLYSVFPAAGNFAIAYVLRLDGAAHDHAGINGMLYTDAGLNVAGVIALSIMLRLLFTNSGSSRPTPLHTPHDT
jgi:PAT family beta-lactamase induction signal transducer AmpG